MVYRTIAHRAERRRLLHLGSISLSRSLTSKLGKVALYLAQLYCFGASGQDIERTDIRCRTADLFDQVRHSKRLVVSSPSALACHKQEFMVNRLRNTALLLICAHACCRHVLLRCWAIPRCKLTNAVKQRSVFIYTSTYGEVNPREQRQDNHVVWHSCLRKQLSSMSQKGANTRKTLHRYTQLNSSLCWLAQ